MHRLDRNALTGGAVAAQRCATPSSHSSLTGRTLYASLPCPSIHSPSSWIRHGLCVPGSSVWAGPISSDVLTLNCGVALRTISVPSAFANMLRLIPSFLCRYGPALLPLPRKVIERGVMKQASLELRPPKFSVHLLVLSSIPGQSTAPLEVTVSLTDKVAEARRAFAEAAAPQKASTTQYRVWRIPSQAASTELLFPADTLRSCGATELTSAEITVEDEFVDSGEAFVVEFMNRGQWLVDASELAAMPNGTAPQTFPPPPPPPLTQPAPLFGSGTDFFSKLQQKSPPAVGTPVISPFKPNALASSKPNASTRPKVQHDPGTMGLGNMLVIASISGNNVLTSLKGKHLFHEFCAPVSGAHPRTHGLFPDRCVSRRAKPG